jgi:hypothetical protein
LGSILLYFQNDPKETVKFGFNEKKENDNKDDVYIGSNRVKRKKKLSKKKKF